MGDKGRVMNPRTRNQIDPIEQAIEKALAPASFISYSACQEALVNDGDFAGPCSQRSS
jgi:hypothetical protein